MKRKLLTTLLLVAALAVAVVAGAASFRAASAATNPVTETAALPVDGELHPGAKLGHLTSEALAKALGISVDELDAAIQQANEAALAQAVEEGLITQEKADEILANHSEKQIGRRLLGQSELDYDALLAEALDISVEELQSAYATAHNALVDQAVADGKLTQEQADLIKGRFALSNSSDYQAAMQSAYASAVEQALEDGVITQAQADQLLANAPSFSGRDGRGGRHGGRGGGAPGDRPARNDQAAPSTTAP